VPNQRPRVVGWQDRNGDGVINLAGAGDANCSAYTSYDASTDGAIIVSGRKYYFNREADPGVQFSGACMPMYRHDPQNQAFSAGVTSLASLKFLYDSGDTFKVLGTPVTLDQFKSSVTAFADGSGDTIAITYAPGGSSDFNICRNAGALAPTDLAATVGNFDTGSAADDVNLTFTAPLANQVNTYTVERSPLGSTTSASATNCNLNAAAGSTSDATGAPTGSSFTTIGVVTKVAGEPAVVTDSDLAAGGYCYRVTTADPVLPLTSFSNYAPANIAAPPPPPGTISATPDFTLNEDNTVSSTVPGNGQHTYTFATGLTGTLSFAVLNSGFVVRNADGTFGFCDQDQNGLADGLGIVNAFIVQVNGLAVPPAQTVRNQTIPANGRATVTIDSAARNTRVRVIAWQDLNNDGQIGLVQIGDINCDSPRQNDPSDGSLTVSGRKFYFGPEGTFGPQFPDASGNPTCQPTYRHDGANQSFSAGPSSGTSLRYAYDANDTFRVLGALVTFDRFRNSLTPFGDGSADKVTITYVPGGVSEFNICLNKGALAPTDTSAALLNADGGTIADDVRLIWTAPSTNTISLYGVQRAVAFSGCSNSNPPNDGTLGNPPTTLFSAVGMASVLSAEQGTFTDFNVALASYCYRISVQDPVFGTISVSNYVAVFVSGGAGDTIPPTSTSATLTTVAGLANALDQGDRFVIDFADTGCGTACGMSIAANAVIRITDSDCGPATNAGPAPCVGGNTNTTADIICGTNAICTPQSGPAGPNTELAIILTQNPTTVSPGSLAGVQLPVVVTDSTGITDLSGNAWNLPGSSDRLVEPPGPVGGPVSTSTRQTAVAGFTGSLEASDAITVDFNVPIALSGGAIIQLTDSDCGPATSAGPSVCTGGTTNTVANIVCGSNASCNLGASPAGPSTELVITLNASASVLAAGSTPGVQLPAVITDSSGIVDAGGHPWSLLGSPDRLVELIPLIGGPTSTSVVETTSGGFANTLDSGDVITADFNQAMSLFTPTVMRVTDSDCGPVTNAGPAACAGGNAPTVSDIICGTNATCTLGTGPSGPNSRLVVTMTSSPSIVAPGSVSGAQFPVVITDSSGIGNSTTGPWNLAGSADRVFGPPGS